MLCGSLIENTTDRFTVGKEALDPVVMGSAQRLEQVVINLVQNACAATIERSRPITITTRISSGNTHGIIEVKDHGTGIEKADLDRIALPFFTTKRDKGGTGLGLSVSQKIVEQHGGTMAFESTQGSGTTVTVSIPLAAPDTQGGS
jgi:polar amino acid transport system substrate-binding protein